MAASAIQIGERQDVLIFQNSFDAMGAGQRDHAPDCGFDRDCADRIRMLGQTVSVESFQNLIYLGQCRFGLLADPPSGVLAFGARRPCSAASAVTVGAKHYDGAHFVARMQPVEPAAELPADFRVDIA
jgi:hypothetical protein